MKAIYLETTVGGVEVEVRRKVGNKVVVYLAEGDQHAEVHLSSQQAFEFAMAVLKASRGQTS